MIVKLKNTFQKLNIEKTHLILNIISIACGTFSIATMLAVGEGLRITFSKIVGDRGQNLLIIKPNHTGKHYRGVHANTIVKLNKKDFNNIVKTSSIISASPRYTVRHPIRYKENTAYSKTMAVNSDYKNIHSIQVEPGGRFINPIDIKESHSVIVLGEKTIEQLFKEEENPIEKTVTINHKKFISCINKTLW